MFLCLLLGFLIIAPAVVVADQKQETVTSSPAIEQANQSASLGTTLAARFPHLQRALIIATIINFVIIVFGLMMYLVKRRMNQFSPASVMRTKQED